MGHNFGMEHDNDSLCHCPDDKCIMAASSRWHNCIWINMFYCLTYTIYLWFIFQVLWALVIGVLVHLKTWPCHSSMVWITVYATSQQRKGPISPIRISSAWISSTCFLVFLDRSLFESPECGNMFVEEGEECDCGLPGRCDNPCCNPATCKLHVNATCATGECCDITVLFSHDILRKKDKFRSS